jgi:hypothetical protein
MNTSSVASSIRPSLSNLRNLPLDSFHLAVWELAQKTSGGPAAFRHRLSAEAHDLLALAQLSGRLLVHWLDLSAGLRAKVEMEVPVPCLPDPAGSLQIAPRALLGVRYPQEALLMPQPGHVFVRILEPKPVWHSNISPDCNQVLCLGSVLSPGFPLSEILLLTYGALSGVNMQIDMLDPQGVLNGAAADWFQRDPTLLPLTREPFIRDEVNHAN